MSNSPQRRVEWDPSKLHFEFLSEDKYVRFQELCLYIAQQCLDDPTLSSIKLYKILFYSDFETFGHYGTPITGWSYRKYPFGPMPTAASQIEAQMVREGLVRIVKRPVYDLSRQRMLPLRDPNYDLFNSKQISIVEYWIRFFWGKTAKEVSDYSHGKAWSIAGMYELIPYEAVFISDDPVTLEDVASVKELAARYGWKM